MVITQKYFDDEYFTDWQNKYKEAQSDLNNREMRMQQCICDLEQDMELLGVTGVEDQLQDDVALTIESIRHAGI